MGLLGKNPEMYLLFIHPLSFGFMTATFTKKTGPQTTHKKGIGNQSVNERPNPFLSKKASPIRRTKNIIRKLTNDQSTTHAVHTPA